MGAILAPFLLMFTCNFYNTIAFTAVSTVENVQKPRLTFANQRYNIGSVLKVNDRLDAR